MQPGRGQTYQCFEQGPVIGMVCHPGTFGPQPQLESVQVVERKAQQRLLYQIRAFNIITVSRPPILHVHHLHPCWHDRLQNLAAEEVENRNPCQTPVQFIAECPYGPPLAVLGTKKQPVDYALDPPAQRLVEQMKEEQGNRQDGRYSRIELW